MQTISHFYTAAHFSPFCSTLNKLRMVTSGPYDTSLCQAGCQEPKGVKSEGKKNQNRKDKLNILLTMEKGGFPGRVGRFLL